MPSILAAPFDRLGQAVGELEQAGARVFHYDVMDGHFVANLSGPPSMIADLEPLLSSQFDVHLMVDIPERFIPWFYYKSVRSISIHVEASSDLTRDFQSIRSQGKQVGIVINPPTNSESLDPYFEKIDQVLVMTVNPGLGGQPFMKEMVPKIEYCARRRDELGLGFTIQVDGGINEDTIREVYEAGANEIVAGSAIYRQVNPVEAFGRMNELIGNLTQNI